ncbi:MAG: hypothetical protein ACRET6_06805, partial [Burkholderiales bacterium]
GCATPVVQTYSGEPKDTRQIAIVKGGASEFANGKYFASFAQYAELEAGKKPEFKKMGDAFAGYAKELHMLPGRYAVMTYCAIGNHFAFPIVNLQVEAGATYEITCAPVADNLSTVRASARRIDAQPKQ